MGDRLETSVELRRHPDGRGILPDVGDIEGLAWHPPWPGIPGEVRPRSVEADIYDKIMIRDYGQHVFAQHVQHALIIPSVRLILRLLGHRAGEISHRLMLKVPLPALAENDR